MEHIIDYINKFADVSMEEMPFNEVDALLLAQFSYFKFEGLIPEINAKSGAVTLSSMAGFMDYNDVFMDIRYARDNRALWDGMLKGRRFREMRCNYFSEMLDETLETQFCAFTVFPEGTLPIVLYRGTDESLVGWKEDFNMAFKKPVPGQQLAAYYLEKVASKLDGQFMIAGHSKGGNIAVYAAMNVKPDIQNKIARIYNFDGPGFRPENFKQEGFIAVCDRIHKFIPQSSIIGMLLENHEEYKVVRSSSVGGILQHDPYSWLVDGAHFEYASKVNSGRMVVNKTFNDWLFGLDEEQLQLLVGTVSEISESTDDITLLDFIENWNKSTPKILHSIKDIDEDTRKEFKYMLHQFGEQLEITLKSRDK